MSPDLRQALDAYLLARADDELVLGHRDSEWTGHGPILEEDIAISNIALDELGHALIWYQTLAEARARDVVSFPDEMAYGREPEEFRNLPFVELPRGGWAFTIVRQYLFDAAETIRLQALRSSSYQPLAAAAAKILPEETYHLRHTSAWVERLGLGTEESRSRMQAALDELWPYASGLFDPVPEESLLAAEGSVPDSGGLRRQWLAIVESKLSACKLKLPAGRELDFSRERPTKHRKELVAALRHTSSPEPEAQW